MSPRVLVVDDEPTIRSVLVRALQMYGYEPFTAATADSAHRVLEEREVDAVLLDVRLTDLPGDVLYYALVRRWPYLRGRIVFMSGDLTQAPDTWPHELLACPRLPKPFHITDLMDLLGRIAVPEASRRRSNGG
ncbi:MAG TPA: response regulator [Gemmatimonadales bacterium]|nr:response regulator [Gemmatimonadales bacterium]